MTSRTQKIRIAVAVGPDGIWTAFGNDREDDEGAKKTALAWLPRKSREGSAIYYITADIPIPQPVEIEGTVEND